MSAVAARAQEILAALISSGHDPLDLADSDRLDCVDLWLGGPACKSLFSKFKKSNQSAVTALAATADSFGSGVICLYPGCIPKQQE